MYNNLTPLIDPEKEDAAFIAGCCFVLGLIIIGAFLIGRLF